jgi:hypothetical protein
MREMTAAQIPCVYCIDVEPDPRVFDPPEPPPWEGFERMLEQVPALRGRLEEATGGPVAFNWFLRMDPQVEAAHGTAAWVAEAYSDAFADLLAAGDEIGIHTHTWRWTPDANTWVADFEDSDWAEHCLLSGLDAFESSMGRPCRSHRGGDHFMTGSLFGCLRDRRVRVDLSVEPGLPPENFPADEARRGAPPEFRAIPRNPYRSSPARFPAPDPESRDDPLLIPLTSARRRRPPFRRWALSSESTANMFAQRIRLELLRPPQVLAFAMRTDSALDSRLEAVMANLDTLSRFKGVRFVTAEAAAEFADAA